MKIKIYKKEKSFTLIEILVSIAVFVLVITAATGIFSSVFQGKQRIVQLKEIEDNGRYALELMSREIRNGTIPASQANNNDSNLSFTDSSGDPVTYSLTSFSGVNTLTKNDSAVTSNKVNISNLRFYVNDFDLTNGPQPRVIITMTIEAVNNSSVEEDFQTTVSPKYDNSQ